MVGLATLSAPLDAPLAGGASGVSDDVPNRLEVALNGHAFRVDHSGDGYMRRSVQVLRNQADTANTPGEQSLNRDAEWRRTAESWHHGAGQSFLDREDSDPYRFHASKGVNVWDKWALSLLNDTSKQRTSANTNLRLTACGTYTYLADGNDLLYTADITATPVVWTTVTGTPASTLLWLTSDGKTVYAAYATGIYSTARGTGTAASYNATSATVLGFVKQRLMAANGPVLYNVLDGATTTTILTHPNADFAWVGFAEGPGYIYAAGYSGNKSAIYKVTLVTDGTALSSPVVAGELPTGETIRTIKGYLGMLVIGTDLGVRLASIDANGFLTFGSLISTTSAVLNLEPSGSAVWYGITNYDGTSTGIGRLDLTTFTAVITPAYASDLMATAQGEVLSISSQGTRRIFTVSGVGAYVESTTKVATGTLTTGRLAYGIGDEKVAMFADLRHAPLAGTVAVALATNDGAAESIGVSDVALSTSPASPLNAGQARGEFFEFTVTLNRDVVTTTGPSVTRLVLRSYPAPSRSFQFVVPVIMHKTQDDLNGNEFSMDVRAERTYLESLLRSQVVVTYQELDQSYSVLLDDIIWKPIKVGPQRLTHEGTAVLSLKEVAS